MKVIGIYFIILGHFFPLGHEYIYAFNVPLFFVISGFLTHHESSNLVFWNKLWHNLIVPCILICTFVLLKDVVIMIGIKHTKGFDLIPLRIINIIAGNQGVDNYGGGLGICWFIYTLVICKILYQYIQNRFFVQLGINIIMLVILHFYNIQYVASNVYIYSSYLNVTIAYPFFMSGVLFRFVYNNHIFKKVDLSWYYQVLCFVCCVFAMGIITDYNGLALLYRADYGHNFFAFFIGASLGYLAIYFISRMIQDLHPKYLITLSKGTIIILGFHNLLIKTIQLNDEKFWGIGIDFLFALLILLLFVPIILMAEKYLPLLLGMRAYRNNK